MTVVMDRHGIRRLARAKASMGPRPDDRGYVAQRGRLGAAAVASMGPRPDDRGYAQAYGVKVPDAPLQWVHGLMTVVMSHQPKLARVFAWASMGPRPDDRGYVLRSQSRRHGVRCFNGSTA